ncbi:MAG: hypothetical protein M5U22_00875 [Thermoleophilia bacterium]|nr:hypothetical protein [Thermoleophilia bacterium]
MTTGPHTDSNTAPFYDADGPAVFHDRADCPAGCAIPASRRRIDVLALRGRLSGW